MNLPGRVLLIEDDPGLGTIACATLARAAIECDHVTTASEARSRFQQTVYTAVVTDINIPDGDGIALVKSLQEIRRTPVIVMTGNPTVKAALAAIEVPLVAFLIKPFTAEILLAEVTRALAAGRVMTEVANTLQQVETWRSELLAFETMLKGAQPSTDAAAALLALNARHLMAAMAELRVQIAAVTAPAANSDAAAEALNTTRPLVLLEAIRDTIAVLDRTKDAFRSRELGELRKRLASLISEIPPRIG